MREKRLLMNFFEVAYLKKFVNGVCIILLPCSDPFTQLPGRLPQYDLY